MITIEAEIQSKLTVEKTNGHNTLNPSLLIGLGVESQISSNNEILFFVVKNP